MDPTPPPGTPLVAPPWRRSFVSTANSPTLGHSPALSPHAFEERTSGDEEAEQVEPEEEQNVEQEAEQEEEPYTASTAHGEQEENVYSSYHNVERPGPSDVPLRSLSRPTSGLEARRPWTRKRAQLQLIQQLRQSQRIGIGVLCCVRAQLSKTHTYTHVHNTLTESSAKERQLRRMAEQRETELRDQLCRLDPQRTPYGASYTAPYGPL
jgi:hypothetical protein